MYDSSLWFDLVDGWLVRERFIVHFTLLPFSYFSKDHISKDSVLGCSTVVLECNAIWCYLVRSDIDHARLLEALVGFTFDSVLAIIQVGSRFARLLVKCSLILLEDLSVLWVMIGGHQVTLLHVSTHVVCFVEVRWLRCGGILVERAGYATLNSISLSRVHSMALDCGSLLLLDQGCRALR